MARFTAISIACLLSVAAALPQATNPTASATAGNGPGASTPADRAAAVRKAFEFAWDGYYRFCIGDDELHPVSNTCGNSR